MTLKAPFPYFGAKSRIASAIWQRFGDVPYYVEPFGGSAAVLLARPSVEGIEVYNDADGYVVNFWRAVQAVPAAVAAHAANPPFEPELHARHAWLVKRRESLRARLEGDPDWFDAKIAGWWVWGMALWIGSGFCSGDGAWHTVDGELVKGEGGSANVRRIVPTLTAYQGVMRKLPEAASNRGVLSERAEGDGIYAYFAELKERFRRVRVTCGDWSRVVTPAVLDARSTCAVLLDPPYSHEGRESDLYSNDDASIYAEVRDWAIENGSRSNLRIAYCGYDDGFAFPDDWEKLTWKANGGYSNQGDGTRQANASKEVVWFSPACLRPATTVQMGLFEAAETETVGGDE